MFSPPTLASPGFLPTVSPIASPPASPVLESEAATAKGNGKGKGQGGQGRCGEKGGKGVMEESFIVVPKGDSSPHPHAQDSTHGASHSHSDIDSETDDEAETASASSVSTAGLVEGLISDTSSAGTGSLSGSIHDWVGGDARSPSELLPPGIAGHAPYGDSARTLMRPTSPGSQPTSARSNASHGSSLGDSYIDAEAFDPTLYGSTTDSLPSLASVPFISGDEVGMAVVEEGAESDIDTDRTPGASIAVIMPRLEASFLGSSTSTLNRGRGWDGGGDSSGSGTLDLTSGESTYGLLTEHKAQDEDSGGQSGSVDKGVDKVDEQEETQSKIGRVNQPFRFVGLFGPLARGPIASSASAAGKAGSQGDRSTGGEGGAGAGAGAGGVASSRLNDVDRNAGRRGKSDGDVDPFNSSPSRYPTAAASETPSHSSATVANVANAASSRAKGHVQDPTAHISPRLRAREEVNDKVPASWLADARIWAPHADDVDGTRSEVPDYSVLGSESDSGEVGMWGLGESYVCTGNDSDSGSRAPVGAIASRRETVNKVVGGREEYERDEREYDDFGMSEFGLRSRLRSRNMQNKGEARPVVMAEKAHGEEVDRVERHSQSGSKEGGGVRTYSDAAKGRHASGLSLKKYTRTRGTSRTSDLSAHRGQQGQGRAIEGEDETVGGEGMVVVREGAGKKWGLLALASLISVALLGSFGPRIPLSVLIPSQTDSRETLLRSAISAIESLTQHPVSSVVDVADVTAEHRAATRDIDNAASADPSMTGNGPGAKGVNGAKGGKQDATTGFAPMALATQLLPLDTLKSVIATLTSGGSNDFVAEDMAKRDAEAADAGRLRYERRTRTAVFESTVIPAPPQALLDTGKSEDSRRGHKGSLAARPSNGVVAVAMAVSDSSYKAWARSLAARIKAETAVVPAGTAIPTAHPIQGMDDSSVIVANSTMAVWAALYHRLAVPDLSTDLLPTQPLSALSTHIARHLVSGVAHAQHGVLVAADWTRSVIMSALAPLLAAMAEDYARLQHLYLSLRSSFSSSSANTSTLLTTADLFSPTTSLLLSLGAHIGHTADAAVYRLQSLHRAVVSFEQEREAQQAAAVRRIAHELSKTWGSLQEGVVLGAREEVGKVYDVARGLVEYWEYVEGGGEEAAGKVGEMGREAARGFKARVSRAGVRLGRAIGEGFRYGWKGEVLDIGAEDATTDSSQGTPGSSGAGDNGKASHDDSSVRVQLQKTPWWSRITTRKAEPHIRPRATRQNADQALRARSDRRGGAYLRGRPWRLRAEQAADSDSNRETDLVGQGTHEKRYIVNSADGRDRRSERARNSVAGAADARGKNRVHGRRRDLAPATRTAKGRLEPYDLARLREMWRGMKRAKRERLKRIMDQVYHGIVPLILG